jgi:hypothetical protein
MQDLVDALGEDRVLGTCWTGTAAVKLGHL